jgi:hypothetical protein
MVASMTESPSLILYVMACVGRHHPPPMLVARPTHKPRPRWVGAGHPKHACSLHGEADSEATAALTRGSRQPLWEEVAPSIPVRRMRVPLCTQAESEGPIPRDTMSRCGSSFHLMIWHVAHVSVPPLLVVPPFVDLPAEAPLSRCVARVLEEVLSQRLRQPWHAPFVHQPSGQPESALPRLRRGLTFPSVHHIHHVSELEAVQSLAGGRNDRKYLLIDFVIEHVNMHLRSEHHATLVDAESAYDNLSVLSGMDTLWETPT